MNRFLLTLAAASLVLGAASCTRTEVPQPKQQEKEKSEESEETPSGTYVSECAPCSNKVVAHRGGAKECGLPDNSRAALKYAMGLKCYAMECDIYWTKDNNVIIAHATNTYYVNNLKPWEHTVEEIRKAGMLTNGESIPTLEDFLDIVQVQGNCTKLVLDIKNLDSNLTAYPIKAAQRACEIIKARNAKEFCEFICTGNETVARGAAALIPIYGVPVGWMANKAPASHKAMGFTWANLCAASAMKDYGTGSRTIDEFKNAGMEISVYNVDKEKYDGNAVYSEEAVAYYVSRYKDLRSICSNYPKWLLSKVQ